MRWCFSPKHLSVFFGVATLLWSSFILAQEQGKEKLLTGRRDEDTGLLLDDYNVVNDNGRWSLSYLANSDLKDVTNITSFEFIYAQKWEFAWVEYSISQTSGTFEAMSTYNSSLGLNNVQRQDLNEASESTLTLGAGLSFRSAKAQEFLGKDWFETMGASITYHQFEEAYQGLSYTGPGLKMDLGLQKRSSKSFFWGVRGSYHLASVKRAAENESETSSQRSLLLHWLSVGVDIGFYY